VAAGEDVLPPVAVASRAPGKATGTPWVVVGGRLWLAAQAKVTTAMVLAPRAKPPWALLGHPRPRGLEE
jgi:hypothetical protein